MVTPTRLCSELRDLLANWHVWSARPTCQAGLGTWGYPTHTHTHTHTHTLAGMAVPAAPLAANSARSAELVFPRDSVSLL